MKNKSLIFSALVALGLMSVSMAQIPSYVPTNGLVGWWPFNGNANDESGNGNNGTVNGATLTTDRFGNANKAYSFIPGTTINVAHNPQLNVDSNYCISVWYNIANDNYPANDILIKGPNDYSGNAFYLRQHANSFQTPTLVFRIDFQGNPGATVQYSELNTNNPNINQWHNVTINTINSTSFMYIDNILVDSVNVPHIGNLINNISNLYFGGGYYPFDGIIDDIAFWNRSLSSCEISNLYNAQVNGLLSSISVTPQVASIGSNVSLSISTNSTSLQWQTNGVNLGWQNVPTNLTYSGGTTNTLTINNVQLSNHNQPFRVIASNGNCSDTSNIATIQIADTCITNVTVYDTLLTTVTDTLIINTTLSLPAPNNENTILIYPNPASDHITIDNGNFAAMAGYSIKIENNAGQQVFQNAINQAQFYVDLSTWTGNGLYFVHLIDPQNNTVTVRKIVLQ